VFLKDTLNVHFWGNFDEQLGKQNSLCLPQALHWKKPGNSITPSNYLQIVVMSRPSALWTLVNIWSVVTYLRVSWSELPLDNAIDLKKPFTAGTAYVITGFAACNKSRSNISLWDYLCEKSSSNFITNKANILKFCLSALSQSFPGHFKVWGTF